MKKLLIGIGILIAFIGLAAGIQLGSSGQVYTMSQNGKYASWVDPTPAILFLPGIPQTAIGVNGNMDIDAATWNVYYKVGGIWIFKGNIKGVNGTTGATGVAGPQGIAGTPGIAGIQGPAGPIGPAGASGAANLPTTGNNFDQLTWYNGAYVLLPANSTIPFDYRGLTASTPLGWQYTDASWPDYNLAGVVKVDSLSVGGSVQLNFVYTDNTGVVVTYNFPVTTVGIFTLPKNKIIKLSPGGSVQVYTIVTGNALYDVTGVAVNKAP